MSDWMNERKENRLYQEIYAEEEISARSYNLAIGGVVLYGILMNVGLCAVVGDKIAYVNPILFFVTYVICCICGTVLSSKSDSALVSFLGFNLVAVPVGLVVSAAVSAYLGAGMADVVVQALVITALITGFMVAFSAFKPEFFEKLGGVLLACLLGLVVAEMVLLLFGVDQIITAWIGAAVFSVYIGYDFYKAQMYPKTLDNAVDSALDIYLDVINLFLRILRILGSRGGSSSRRR